MSDRFLKTYQSLEKRIEEQDVSLFNDILTLSQVIEHDFTQYDSVLGFIAAHEEHKKKYTHALEHYTHAKEIQGRIIAAVPGFVEHSWNTAVQNPEIDFALLQHIEALYSQLAIPAQLYNPNTQRDIEDWKYAKEQEQTITELVAIIYAKYISTSFASQQEAQTFFEINIKPFQEEQERLLRGKHYTQHYPHYLSLENVAALAQDEIARFDTLSAARQSQLNLIAAMEADVEYIESRSFTVAEQRQEILDCAAKVYAEPVAIDHPKYGCATLYQETRQRLDETRETIIQSGIETLETQIKDIAHQESITISDRKKTDELLSVLRDVQQQTGYIYDTALDAVVASLTDESSYCVTVALREAACLSYSSPPEVSSNPVHPGYVAARLAQLQVPGKYTPLHATLVHGAQRAVVATARLFSQNTFSYSSPESREEQDYLSAVKGLFSSSRYVQQHL